METSLVLFYRLHLQMVETKNDERNESQAEKSPLILYIICPFCNFLQPADRKHQWFIQMVHVRFSICCSNHQMLGSSFQGKKKKNWQTGSEAL